MGGGPLAKEGGMDWAVWQLGGVQAGGTGRTTGKTESFGVLNRCWTGPASADHFGVIQQLMMLAGRPRLLRLVPSCGCVGAQLSWCLVGLVAFAGVLSLQFA